jgi:copper chaperone
MKTIELKTNIMCSSCVAKVTPSLNETVGASNWKVDTENPKKILTVSTDTLTEAAIIKAVEKAGYKAEKVAP